MIVENKVLTFDIWMLKNLFSSLLRSFHCLGHMAYMWLNLSVKPFVITPSFKRPKQLSITSPHGMWLFHSVKPFVIKPSVKRPKLLSFISPHGMKKLLFLFLFAIQVCAVSYNKYLLPLFSFPVLRLRFAWSKSCQSGQCMVSYGRSHLWRSYFYHQKNFFSRHSLAASRESSKNLSRPAEEICQGDFLRRSNTCLGVSLYVSFRYYVDKCSIFIFFLFFQEGNRFWQKKRKISVCVLLRLPWCTMRQ